MKQCHYCHLDVITNSKVCPLCQNILTKDGQKKEDIFPYIPTISKKYRFFFQILIFISILISVICLFINYLFPTPIFWSLFVALGFLCLLILLKVSLKTPPNPKTVLIQVLLLSIFSLLWDYFTTWRGWSITYVIPILSLVGSIDIAILGRILHIYIEDYLFYFLILIAFGLIPIIFIFTNLVSNIYPSIICIFLNIAALLSLIIFFGPTLLEELKKRFHF